MRDRDDHAKSLNVYATRWASRPRDLRSQDIQQVYERRHAGDRHEHDRHRHRGQDDDPDTAGPPRQSRARDQGSGKDAGLKRHATLRDKRRSDSLLLANGHPRRLAPRSQPVARQLANSSTPEAERFDSVIQIGRRKQPPQELFV